jgi:hypothetical protein
MGYNVWSELAKRMDIEFVELEITGGIWFMRV